VVRKKKPALVYEATEFRDTRQIPKLKTARFNGKTYRIVYGRSDEALGGCERRSKPRPRLFLDDRLLGVARLDVALHEAVHACLGGRLSEQEAVRVSQDVARFILRLYHADPDQEVIARCQREGQKPLVNLGSMRWAGMRGE
jgi:hypothetical protein